MFIESAYLTVTEDPMTWDQASKTKDASAWKLALEDEFTGSNQERYLGNY